TRTDPARGGDAPARMPYTDSLMPSELENDLTRRIAADRRGLKIMSLDLVVVHGPSRGLRAPIDDGFARVGTGQGAHLRLVDPTVSRIHCDVRVRPEGIVVKDCSSTNGTFVADVRVREGEVQPGAVIRIGDSAFRIEPAEGQSFVALSDRTSFGELLGESLEMRHLYAILDRIAPTHSTLLIEGETGTGKDV